VIVIGCRLFGPPGSFEALEGRRDNDLPRISDTLPDAIAEVTTSAPFGPARLASEAGIF
jgi:hypothetical protein